MVLDTNDIIRYIKNHLDEYNKQIDEDLIGLILDLEVCFLEEKELASIT